MIFLFLLCVWFCSYSRSWPPCPCHWPHPDRYHWLGSLPPSPHLPSLQPFNLLPHHPHVSYFSLYFFLLFFSFFLPLTPPPSPHLPSLQTFNLLPHHPHVSYFSLYFFLLFFPFYSTTDYFFALSFFCLFFSYIFHHWLGLCLSCPLYNFSICFPTIHIFLFYSKLFHLIIFYFPLFFHHHWLWLRLNRPLYNY